MSNKSLVGSESHLANMDSPTSDPVLLKAQSRQFFIGLQQSHVTTESTINILYIIQILDTITVLYVTNLGDDNSVTKPFASLHETGFLLQLQQRDGHDAIITYCKDGGTFCRSRELKLLVGSGCWEFPKGMAGMDSLDKHVEQVSFPQCITCCEHGQPKGWPPRCRSTISIYIVTVLGAATP